VDDDKSLINKHKTCCILTRGILTRGFQNPTTPVPLSFSHLPCLLEEPLTSLPNKHRHIHIDKKTKTRKMLGAQFPARTFSGFKTLKTTDQGNYPTCRLISPQKNPPPSPSCSFQFSVKRIRCRFQCPRSISVSCKASSDSSGSPNAHNNNNNGLDYLPASLLVSGSSPSLSLYV